ncbi:MAG: hypothetical protein LBV44_06325, partial [Methylobacillus sp.]|nr:hypothetical protein [Methylobacillus sp.]
TSPPASRTKEDKALLIYNKIEIKCNKLQMRSVGKLGGGVNKTPFVLSFACPELVEGGEQLPIKGSVHPSSCDYAQDDGSGRTEYLSLHGRV